MSKQVDIIIYGGGIAGRILADTLSKKDSALSVVLVDLPQQNRSSSVAAGIFNPITGKMGTLTWNAAELFSFLRQYYSQLQEQTGSSFFYELPLYRVFKSAGEQNDWTGKSNDDHIKPFLNKTPITHLPDPIMNPLGALALERSGWVDIRVLLAALETHRPKNLQYSTPELAKSVSAKSTIWCNGFEASKIEGIQGLPWRPVRGELMEIELPGLPNDKILNKGCFVMPYRPNRWLLGATYDHNLNATATDKGKQWLLNQFNGLFPGEPIIHYHRWGIRPATSDRRPIIGEWKDNHFLFNGFGSKGVSLVPYYANQFAEHLLNNSSLDEEVDIRRFTER